MKIKEILTPEELEECHTWGVYYDGEKLEGRLIRHVPEMTISEFCLYRIAEHLEDIKYQGAEE